MQITIHNPNDLPTIDYTTVKAFQDDLKTLKDNNYEKLKNVLIKRGFDIPLFLWHDTSDNQYYLLDGHQRVKVMIKEDMNDNGSKLVPYIKLSAKDRKEAKAKLLEITSQYGTITQEGLDEYLALAELPELEVIEAVSFDALPLLGINSDFEPDAESEQGKLDEKKEITCPECGHVFTT